LTDAPQLISESSFQTIESLLAWLVDELREKFFDKEDDDDSWIRLRIEKPQAVPFADAPAVEIMRPVRVD
jgi:dihydroneopterin aldolase